MPEEFISAARLRAARGLLHWRQSDLADAAGLHVRSLQQIERGVRGGRPETHAKLRAALESAGVAFTRDGVRLAGRRAGER